MSCSAGGSGRAGFVLVRLSWLGTFVVSVGLALRAFAANRRSIQVDRPAR